MTGILIDRPRPPLRNRRGRIRCHAEGCPEWAIKTEVRPTAWSVAESVPVCHTCSHEGGLETHFGLSWSEIQERIRERTACPSTSSST